MEWIQLTETTQPDEKKPVLVCIKDEIKKTFIMTTAHRKKKSFYLWDFRKKRFLKAGRDCSVVAWAVDVPMP